MRHGSQICTTSSGEHNRGRASCHFGGSLRPPSQTFSDFLPVTVWRRRVTLNRLFALPRALQPHVRAPINRSLRRQFQAAPRVMSETKGEDATGSNDVAKHSLGADAAAKGALLALLAPTGFPPAWDTPSLLAIVPLPVTLPVKLPVANLSPRVLGAQLAISDWLPAFNL